MSNNEYYLRLRIPEILRRQLLKSATVNNRSMTAEILTRLQASFGSDDRSEVANDDLQSMQDRLSFLEEQFHRHVEKTKEQYPSRKAFRIAGE